VAVPCAVVAIAIVALLGPPVSSLLYPAKLPFRFLPGDAETVTPEPLEGTRYLLALAAPVLLAAATVAAVRWTRRPMSSRTTAMLTRAAQCVGLGVVVICMVNQHKPRWGVPYFGMTALVVAAAITVGLVWSLRSASLLRRSAAWTRETHARRIGLPVVAAVLTAIWVMPGVNSEASITWAYMLHDTAFQFDETSAILNGLTPWVDFNTQYAALFPFGIGLSLLVFGKTVLAFTITLCSLTAVVLLAMYGVFRRITGSSLLALLLYVPFLTMSLFAVGRTIVRFDPGVYFPIFPLRYGGAFLLAWLLARKLGQRSDARAWPVFIAAGFVMLNNFEFGVPAFIGAVAALVVTAPRRAVRLAGEVAAGLGVAFLLYSLFTLARAGAWPHPLRAAEFARLYGTAGYSVAPLPGVIGFPLVMFLTYVAAFGTATVRTLNGERNRILTGMLMWSSVFGFGSATYYVARSNDGLLPMMFSGWALAVLLLTVVVVQTLARGPPRIPSVASLTVLFAFAIAVCSFAQLPTPWTQLQRIKAPTPEFQPEPSDWAKAPTQDPRVRRFVASIADGPHSFVLRSGAPVALFITTGHRVADAYGVVDVVSYTGPESIHTFEQLEETFDALLRAGGNTALVRPAGLKLLREGLLRRGFAILTRSGLRRSWPADQKIPPGTLLVGGFTKWIDTRHLHAAWLHRS